MSIFIDLEKLPLMFNVLLSFGITHRRIDYFIEFLGFYADSRRLRRFIFLARSLIGIKKEGLR